jgi:spoIIIJ-associated protein
VKEIIFEGKTEEDALKNASETLKIPEPEIKYEVLEKETGIFGLFSKNTKIRVFVQESICEESEEKSEENEALEQSSTRMEDEYFEEDEIHHKKSSAEKKVVYKGDKALMTLQNLLDLMDVQAEVTMKEDDECIQMNIKTPEEEIITGRDGKTLHALQFMLNKIVNRMPEDRKRILIDSEGFRSRREQALIELAKTLGEKSKRLGKVIGINPMNPQDRRIIHLALKDDRELTTRSDGSGLFRRLLLIPPRKK